MTHTGPKHPEARSGSVIHAPKRIYAPSNPQVRASRPGRLIVTQGVTPDLRVLSRPGPDATLSLHGFPHGAPECVISVSDAWCPFLAPRGPPCALNRGEKTMESSCVVPTVATATSRVDELSAMRRVLAARLDSGQLSPRDTVPIVRQLREVSKEIEVLEAVPVEDEHDRSTDDAPFYMAAI